MAGDEVDRTIGFTIRFGEEIGAGDHARGQYPDRVLIPLHKPADIIPKTPIPLRPTVPDKRPDLIEARGIPRFGDDLRPREDGVGFDLPQDRRVAERVPIFIAGHDRSEVEPEPVYVHLTHPIPQTVHDQPPDDGVVGFDRIAGPAMVFVNGLVFGVEDVIRPVFDAPEGQRGAFVVAFGSVVEDDIENHFQPRLVQGFDQVAEFVDGGERVGGETVPPVRGE